MKLTLLGTRGEIESPTRRHFRHTATMVSYRGYDVMIDCGADWRGHWQGVNPRALAREREVEAEIATDGMEVVLR